MVGGVQLSENWGCRIGFCGPLEGGVHLAPDLFFSRIS